MYELQLTQGQVAIVSKEDFDRYSWWKWHAAWNSCTKSFYARRNSKTADGKRHFVFLHREILGLSYGDTRRGDHIDCNTLDNRRENLRVASASENNWNTRTYSNNTSGVKGVSLHKLTGKWQVNVRKHRKVTYGGLFKSFDEACTVALRIRSEAHGDFARVG